MKRLLGYRNLLGLAILAMAAFAVHGEEAGGAGCCAKPAEGAAMSCCSSGAKTTAASTEVDPHAAHGEGGETADPHAAHAAAATSDADPHAGHETASADGGHGAMSCCSMGGGKMGHTGQGGGMGGRGAVMPDAMRLLHNYSSLERKVEEIPSGVKTTTTTQDPAVLELLRRHPREMYAYYEGGGVVRPHDPIFSELSRVADRVTMEFKDVENGIEVTATSNDPEVVKLIRAHAYKVSEFVKRGMAALHEGAPLPQDYQPTK